VVTAVRSRGRGSPKGTTESVVNALIDQTWLAMPRRSWRCAPWVHPVCWLGPSRAEEVDGRDPGLDGPIVPPSQSEAIAADLAAHGIRHAYIAFAGESHGFRKAETVIAALEAELAFYGEIFGFTPPGVPPIELS
jgi:hypothetical protein